MDPNEAVKVMRNLSMEIDCCDDEWTRSQLAEEMASVWDGLDQWLTNGGRLPSEWYDVV